MDLLDPAHPLSLVGPAVVMWASFDRDLESGLVLWPSAIAASFFAHKDSYCCIMAFSAPMVKFLSRRERKGLTKANSHKLCNRSILGKCRQPSPNYLIVTPGILPLSRRMWSTIKHVFLLAVSLCVWLSEKCTSLNAAGCFSVFHMCWNTNPWWW